MMATIHYLVVILALTFTRLSRACDLVPSNDGSCFELSASAYLTFATTQFGPAIEGASVNPDGEMFAVHFGGSESTHQLGQMYPQQRLFYSDVIPMSYLNGIRFLNSATAFIADVTNQRILKLTVDSENVVTNSSTYCTHKNMIQPNDLTLSITGTVFTSGENYVHNTDDTDGDIWSCLPDGTVKRLELMGRTNGIDLTPDEQHLYVSESYTRDGVPIVQKIWKYASNVHDGTITSKTLFADFDEMDNSTAFDIDGMKTDTNGNLFVARYGGSHVAIISAEGSLIGKIALSFQNPTNLEFGGPHGTTLFIVGQCEQVGKGCVDQIEVNTPGRSWSILQASNAWRTLGISMKLQLFSLIVPIALFTVRT